MQVQARSVTQFAVPRAKLGSLTILAATLLGATVAAGGGMAWAMPIILPAAGDSYVRTDLDVRRNDNYGAERLVGIGTSRGGGGIPFGGPDAMRPLLLFDLSSITAPSVVRARLSLSILSFPNGINETYTIDVHRLIGPWVEGNGAEGPAGPGAMGTDPAFGVAWVGAGDGGDDNNQTQPPFDPAVWATAVIDQATAVPGAVVAWDVTSLVNAWLSGTPNHGLLLRDVTEGTGTFRAVFLGAREGELFDLPDAVAGPRLEIQLSQPASLALLGVTLFGVWAWRLARRSLKHPLPGAHRHAGPGHR